MTFQTGYTRTYGFARHTIFLLVCMRASQIRATPYLRKKKRKDSAGSDNPASMIKGLLTTRQRDGQSPSEMAVGSVEKDVESQRHHTFMVCYARVWIGTPTVRLVLRGNAAVQFFDSIQQLLHNERGLTC